MVYGLPNFGNKSLIELQKKRINMSIQPIHHDCKEHIRKCTRGKEYLSRTEWENFSKDVCNAYLNPRCEKPLRLYWIQFNLTGSD